MRPDTSETAPPPATRGAMTRDFLIFQLKLMLDGLKDVLVFNASLVAYVLDLLLGRGRRRRFFYAVLEASERFDLWLNLHGPASRAGEDEDGLYGVSAAGDDTLLGKLEQWTRGGDEPRRGPRSRRGSRRRSRSSRDEVRNVA